MTLKHLIYYWINVYEVTRHYGGPEGGGWWYDWMRCIKWRRVLSKWSDEMREEEEQGLKHLEDLHTEHHYKIVALVEDHRAQSHTKEVPTYEGNTTISAGFRGVAGGH